MKPFAKNAPWQTNRSALEQLPIKQIKLFACDVARLAVPIYEQYFPKDNRPRFAIETAELFLYGKTTKEQLDKAANAIWAAIDAIDAIHAANAIWAVRDAVHAAKAAVYASFSTAWSVNVIHAANAAADAAWASTHATHAANGTKLHEPIQFIFKQTKQTPIPITPTLKAIATNIVQTRNFQEYFVLLDNLEEFHNIQLERTVPLGLSHFVLYTLTNTN